MGSFRGPNEVLTPCPADFAAGTLVNIRISQAKQRDCFLYTLALDCQGRLVDRLRDTPGEVRILMNRFPRCPVLGSRAAFVFCAALLAGLLSMPVPVHADTEQDFLLFPSIEGFERFSDTDPANDGFSDHVMADFLYTLNTDRFRLLAEYFWSNKESELERLQAAWLIDDDTTLWAGRFHSVSNYWASEFHHGVYLQTTISRPGLDEWEDNSGPMPSHITGFEFDQQFMLQGDAGLRISLVAGLAPTFAGTQLVPFDLLDSNSGNESAFEARLIYQPELLSGSQIGFSAARNEIAVDSSSSPDLANLDNIRQVTVGVFVDWEWPKWHLLTNWVYFDIDMDYIGARVEDDFILAYVQAEFEASDKWTLFARTEFGFDEDDSPYLRLLPAFIAHRHMLGARWDFTDSQALTGEIADTSTQGDDFTHDNFKELRLQWSAVFP